MKNNLAIFEGHEIRRISAARKFQKNPPGERRMKSMMQQEQTEIMEAEKEISVTSVSSCSNSENQFARR